MLPGLLKFYLTVCGVFVSLIHVVHTCATCHARAERGWRRQQVGGGTPRQEREMERRTQPLQRPTIPPTSCHRHVGQRVPVTRHRRNGTLHCIFSSRFWVATCTATTRAALCPPSQGAVCCSFPQSLLHRHCETADEQTPPGRSVLQVSLSRAISQTPFPVRSALQWCTVRIAAQHTTSWEREQKRNCPRTRRL